MGFHIGGQFKPPGRLSRSVDEILSFKDFGVIALTFWGHVTSSVTWPLDSWFSDSWQIMVLLDGIAWYWYLARVKIWWVSTPYGPKCSLPKNAIWVGQHERLYLFCLWTKVHHLFDQLLFRFSICGSVPEIFVIEVDSCLKSRRILDVFCPPKFCGAGLPQKLCPC